MMDVPLSGVSLQESNISHRTVKGRSSTKKCGLRHGKGYVTVPRRATWNLKNNHLKQTPHLPISPIFEFHIGSNVSVQGSVSLDREPSLVGVSVNLLFSLIPCG